MSFIILKWCGCFARKYEHEEMATNDNEDVGMDGNPAIREIYIYRITHTHIQKKTALISSVVRDSVGTGI